MVEIELIRREPIPGRGAMGPEFRPGPVGDLSSVVDDRVHLHPRCAHPLGFQERIDSWTLWSRLPHLRK